MIREGSVQPENRAKLGKPLFWLTPSRMAKKRSGIFFYAVPVFLLVFFSPAYALNMSSEKFTVAAEVENAGGGFASSDTYRVMASIGDVSSSTSAVTYDLCAGLICSFLEFLTTGKITFLLEFNISGAGNDTAFVDNYTQYRQYRATNLIKHYACIHDVNLPSSPAFGIIFSGSKLNYINLSSGNSYVLRVSQDIAGNRVILPVTSGNCTVFDTRLSQIAEFGTILQPFVLGSEIASTAVELSIKYPSVDIIGQFQRAGSFTLIIEKNETNENQIIIKPA